MRCLLVAIVLWAGCRDESLPAPPEGGVPDAAAADGAAATTVDAAASDDAAGDATPVEGGVGPDLAGANVTGLGDLVGGPCAVEVAMPRDEGANHVTTCAPVSYASKPPASGNHYPVWPVFRVYDQPVPWGFLVHGLEHGAVVIAYHCADGCPDQLAALKAMVAALPPKEGCPRPPVIVTPDPTLDVPFAASAWDYTVRARCFDRDRFTAFVQRRMNHGPEYFPTDCGSVDLEKTGWCP